MGMQGWIVIGAVAVAALFFGRKFLDNLDRKGGNAGCGCSGGGGCGNARQVPGSPNPAPPGPAAPPR